MSRLEVQHPGEVPMLLDGRDVPAEDGRWIDVVNPADGQEIGRVPRAGDVDVDRAVRAARGALDGWRSTDASARGAALHRIAELVRQEAEQLARLSSLENGNAVRTQTRGEAAFVAEAFTYFAGLVREAKGETVPLRSGALDYSRREPLGVVGAIVPWNAPLMLSAVKIAPALAAGNTMVLKLAEDAPFAILALARLCQQVLPPGVLNVVTGYGSEAGEALTSHPGIDKLTFTGSTAVGRRVMAKASERVVPVSLELGGKSPQIVYPDSDLDWVADGVVAGMRFFRQGQSCTAGSRVFVHASIFDSFLAKVVDRLEAMQVGDPLEESSDIGSIVNEKQYTQVCDYIREGMEQPGVRVLTGGLPEEGGNGWFVRPTVFAEVDNRWRLATEEIFGPVMCAIRWEDEAEVVAAANASHYGLAAFVWCQDVGAALRTAHRLEAGWVQVNQGGGQALGQSYGGYKQSGIGREFSLEGMLEGYTHRKHVSVSLEH